MQALPHLCALEVRTGQIEQAQQHLERAQAILANGEDWGGLPGEVYLAEGQVRAAQGRWAEAEAAFERAIAVDQQYELLWDEAKVYYEWGCSLYPPAPFPQPRGKGEQDGVREQARALLGRAMEMWDTMGAGPWADKCRARLAPLA